MRSIKLVSATEARQNLFKLLKMAESGAEVLITKKDSNTKFTLTPVKEASSSSKKEVVKSLAALNFKSNEPEKIKEIVETQFDL